jgi:hypothetical protein
MAAVKSASKGVIYFRMADMLIDSLRRLGEFTGDILVFTDEPSWFENRGVLIEEIGDQGHPLEVRFSSSIKAANYEKIMFLDCDILCIGSISDLFNANNEVLYVLERNKLMTSERFGYLFLTAEERNRFKDEFIINAGTFCVDAAYYDYFSGLWREFWRSYIDDFSKINNPYNDQAMLNALLRRGKVRCRLMGENVVAFPFIRRKPGSRRLTSLNENCKFIHYNSDITQEYKEGDFEEVKRYYEKRLKRE